jgi:hypothetical protein
LIFSKNKKRHKPLFFKAFERFLEAGDEGIERGGKTLQPVDFTGFFRFSFDYL